MKNIEKFRKVRFYQGNRELTKEELIPLGLANDVYETLEERAYQAAYDISNDLAKETPEWSDVEEGFRKGVSEGIEYMSDKLKVFYKVLIDRENNIEYLPQQSVYHEIAELFIKTIKED
jgi:hypothetical protein